MIVTVVCTKITDNNTDYGLLGKHNNPYSAICYLQVTSGWL